MRINQNPSDMCEWVFYQTFWMTCICASLVWQHPTRIHAGNIPTYVFHDRLLANNPRYTITCIKKIEIQFQSWANLNIIKLKNVSIHFTNFSFLAWSRGSLPHHTRDSLARVRKPMLSHISEKDVIHEGWPGVLLGNWRIPCRDLVCRRRGFSGLLLARGNLLLDWSQWWGSWR